MGKASSTFRLTGQLHHHHPHSTKILKFFGLSKNKYTALSTRGAPARVPDVESKLMMKVFYLAYIKLAVQHIRPDLSSIQNSLAQNP